MELCNHDHSNHPNSRMHKGGDLYTGPYGVTAHEEALRQLPEAVQAKYALVPGSTDRWYRKYV